MCRSEPQIAVDVMRMIASRGFKMRGSGTSSTRSFSLPYQTFAFIVCSGSIAAGQAPAAHSSTHQGAAARGLAVGCGDFACFQQLFEATQILLDLGLRILPQQPGEGCGQTATYRPVVDTESHYRT